MRIQEIAEKAGVSTATVSRVFSHHPNIREEIREKVFAVARECGYHPRLSTKQRNIVILFPYRAVYPIQSYVEMVLAELSSELAGRGYRVELLPRDNMERLRRIQFCGAVAIGLDPEELKTWDDCYAAPLVLIDRDAPSGVNGIFSIRSDEPQGMALAIGRLAERGCRRVGTIIYGEDGSGNTRIRYDGVVRALRNSGLPADPNLIRFSRNESYVEEIGKFLKLGVDGLFCPGGNAGIVAAYSLGLFGKRVPEDIALIASERSVFSRYASPPQTAISQDYTEQARLAADALDARLSGRDFPQRTVIPYKLILRDSA